MAARRKSQESPPAKPAAKAKKPEAASHGGRSVWTGQLRLALVTIPVQLTAATSSSAHIAFHQVDKISRKRIKYEKVAPGVGPVAPENIVKGFEVSRGQYVLIDDEDLDKIKMESKRVIDLVQFVDHCEIDPLYFDNPYFVLPDGKGASEAYTVLRDAMRSTGKMGIGQFVMRGREYIAALKPCGKGLMLETLRFADEVRNAAPFFADIGEEEPDKELLDLAEDLIRRKVKPFDPGTFQDHYTDALRALIEAKSKHQVSVEDTAENVEPARGNVVDLVEALRQSVRSQQPTSPPPRKRQNAR